MPWLRPVCHDSDQCAMTHISVPWLIPRNATARPLWPPNHVATAWNPQATTYTDTHTHTHTHTWYESGCTKETHILWPWRLYYLDTRDIECMEESHYTCEWVVSQMSTGHGAMERKNWKRDWLVRNSGSGTSKLVVASILARRYLLRWTRAGVVEMDSCGSDWVTGSRCSLWHGHKILVCAHEHDCRKVFGQSHGVFTI